MISDSQTFKPISAADSHRLADLEEARDLLINVSMVQGDCIASFKFGAIRLPPEMEPKLSGLCGKRIACLRLDGKFYIRNLETENAA